jgi:hypothetical protein
MDHCHLYAATVRRLNRRFNVWLYSQALWSFLLTYFVMSLAITYAIFWAGDWVFSHVIHMPGAGGQSTLYHFGFAAWLTAIGLIGRRKWRRRFGLTPSERS